MSAPSDAAAAAAISAAARSRRAVAFSAMLAPMRTPRFDFTRPIAFAEISPIDEHAMPPMTR